MNIEANGQLFGIPVLDLDAFNLEELPTHLLQNQLFSKHEYLPLKLKGKHLYLAITEPTRILGLDEIKYQLGFMVSLVLVEKIKLEKFFQCFEKKAPRILSGNLPTPDAVKSAPIVVMVNDILQEAINKNASDVHFEVYENTYRVRYRIDGVLAEISKPSVTLIHQITTRIKIMANLDIAERRLPQDGHFKLEINSELFDFRVSTCPTLYSEKIVVRILTNKMTVLDYHSLGIDRDQEQILVKSVQKTQGLILVTGPTGSGKTMTLYSILKNLNRNQVNILTIEDPVEISIEGINQVSINPKAGLTFATALRAFLRQDPDIIMIGEIRDLETAEIALRAAQTGHLVLATLHTTGAVEAINRLIQMGVTKYDLASCVSLIIAQRLIRKLCRLCRKKLLHKTDQYEACGCKQCYEGFQGRVGIFEFLLVEENLRQAILDQANLRQIAKNQGVKTLLENGLAKVKEGITCLTEVMRAAS